MKSSACSCAEVSYTDRMESHQKVTRTKHYWQKENKVVLSWSNLDFMDFTRREISFGTITRFIQWICAGISLTGSEWDVCVCGGGVGWGGYMLATDPLFVQKSSMWPPLCRFTVSLTAVNSTRKHVKQLFVDCHSEVCARARTCDWSSHYPWKKFQSAKKWKVQHLDLFFFLSMASDKLIKIMQSETMTFYQQTAYLQTQIYIWGSFQTHQHSWSTQKKSYHKCYITSTCWML